MTINCPKCGKEIDHFEHIGEIENKVCPECKQSITDAEAPSSN